MLIALLVYYGQAIITKTNSLETNAMQMLSQEPGPLPADMASAVTTMGMAAGNNTSTVRPLMPSASAQPSIMPPQSGSQKMLSGGTPPSGMSMQGGTPPSGAYSPASTGDTQASTTMATGGSTPPNIPQNGTGPSGSAPSGSAPSGSMPTGSTPTKSSSLSSPFGSSLGTLGTQSSLGGTKTSTSSAATSSLFGSFKSPTIKPISISSIFGS